MNSTVLQPRSLFATSEVVSFSQQLVDSLTVRAGWPLAALGDEAVVGGPYTEAFPFCSLAWEVHAPSFLAEVEASVAYSCC